MTDRPSPGICVSAAELYPLTSSAGEGHPGLHRHRHSYLAGDVQHKLKLGLGFYEGKRSNDILELVRVLIPCILCGTRLLLKVHVVLLLLWLVILGVSSPYCSASIHHIRNY